MILDYFSEYLYWKFAYAFFLFGVAQMLVYEKQLGDVLDSWLVSYGCICRAKLNEKVVWIRLSTDLIFDLVIEHTLIAVKLKVHQWSAMYQVKEMTQINSII